MRRLTTTITTAAAAIGLTATAALAGTSPLWEQGFETDTAGWFDSDDAWVGTVERVESGTDGVASSSGDWHALVSSDDYDPADAGNAENGPFSRFADPYPDSPTAYPGDSIAELDVYLDPAWAVGEGFDYSVAMNRDNDDADDSDFLRDFIFHVGVVEGEGLLVNASNNTDFRVNPFKLRNENGGAFGTVTEAGWYTLQHAFAITADGVLEVTMSVLDDDGAAIFSAVRSNPADTADQVGGQRYGWFTAASVGGGLAVDDHELLLVTPTPGEKDDCKQGGFEAFGFDNQGQCVASIQAADAAGR